MKRRHIVLCLSLFLLTGCASNLVEEIGLTEESELYEAHIEEIDNTLAECSEREKNSISYKENLNSIYLFEQDSVGWLLAQADESGLISFSILMEESLGNEVYERQKYECCLLEDDSLWFTYETTYDELADIPDYAVNEDVMRYERVDYVTNSGYAEDSFDKEAVKSAKEQEWQENFSKTIQGKKQEYWYTEGTLYLIDRDKKSMNNVTEETDICLAAFLEQQPDRIRMQYLVKEENLEFVNTIKPSGYCLLYSWNNVATCDLNKDGVCDYVAALYPEDYETEVRYGEYSVYEHSSEYYAAGLWLFLSDGQNGFEEIMLSDDLEYNPDCLTLISIRFVADGLLELEYFIGRSPFYNAVIQFRYNVEEKTFFIEHSYYRDSGSFTRMMCIGDAANYGEFSIRNYYEGTSIPYNEMSWVSEEDIELSEGNYLKYYSSTFQYITANKLEEQHINNMIWEKENELLQILQERYYGLEVSLYPTMLFHNNRLVSGYIQFRGEGNRMEEGISENQFVEFGRINVPVMIDRKTGNYVKVSELIEKEEFISLFEQWAEGSNDLTEKEQGKKILQEHWEAADSVENLTNGDGNEIWLQITQEGVIVGLWTEQDNHVQQKYFQIDKEHFIGTDLWYYMEPEWMQ